MKMVLESLLMIWKMKLYINKVGLEDLITFHDAEFELIDGYYYNEGRNQTMNDVIKKYMTLERN